MEACEHHLEGFTGSGKKDADVGEQIEQLDQYIALATCLRENIIWTIPQQKRWTAGWPTFKTVIDWE